MAQTAKQPKNPYAKMSLEKLTAAFDEAKQLEDKAKDVRLQVEEEILGRVEKELKDAGTNWFGPLKIITGFTNKWDQDKLKNIRESNQELPWPFEVEFKPMSDRIEWMKENYPDFWKKVESSALTQSRRKPTFSFDPKKQEEK